MKKLVLSILSTLPFAFFTPLAYAITVTGTSIDPCLNAGTFDVICRLGGSKGGSVGGVISSFISLFFAIAAILAVIYLMYGGIKWITSRGEKAELEAARAHVIAAIVGLIMVFLAFFLINFVLGFFIQGFSLTSITLPSLSNIPTAAPN